MDIYHQCVRALKACTLSQHFMELLHMSTHSYIIGDMIPSKRTFIPSSEYRRILTALCKIQDLFTTVHATDTVDTDRKERQIFYSMSAQGDQITLSGYIVHPSTTVSEYLTEVHPEREFCVNDRFWVGAPQHIFKDFDPLKDKKLGRLAWAATYDRETMYETFKVALSSPIVTMVFSKLFLDRWIETAPAKVIDTSVLNHTLDDLPKDAVPAGIPTFGNKTAKE